MADSKSSILDIFRGGGASRGSVSPLSFFWNGQRPMRSVLFSVSTLWATLVFLKAMSYLKYVLKYKGKYPGPAMAVLGMMPPKEMAEKGGFTQFIQWGHSTYGPIFEFFMGFEYHVSIDRPEALAQVHKKGDERPDSTYKVVNYLFKENVLFQHGDWQRILRRSYQSIIDSD